MSGEGISTLAHRMINDVLRTSRRRFLTQAGAAGLGIGVPVSMTIAQETQRSLVGDGKEVSLGEKLARFATSLRYEDLPEDVIRIAKRTILDTLGCAFGGYSAGPSKIAMKQRREFKAAWDNLAQRHQDEPRAGGVRQRRDDPLSGFQ